MWALLQELDHGPQALPPGSNVTLLNQHSLPEGLGEPAAHAVPTLGTAALQHSQNIHGSTQVARPNAHWKVWPVGPSSRTAAGACRRLRFAFLGCNPPSHPLPPGGVPCPYSVPHPPRHPHLLHPGANPPCAEARCKCEARGITSLNLRHVRADPRNIFELSNSVDISQYKAAIVLAGACGEGPGWDSGLVVGSKPSPWPRPPAAG